MAGREAASLAGQTLLEQFVRQSAVRNGILDAGQLLAERIVRAAGREQRSAQLGAAGRAGQCGETGEVQIWPGKRGYIS